MVNYHEELVATLKTILPTYYELVLESGIKTPCISYIEMNNSETAQGDTLGYSRVIYKIKVWGESLSDLQTYSQEIDTKLRQLGWMRTSTQELYDTNSAMKQKIMNFEALFKETY